MNLLEFKSLIEWVATEVAERKIPQKYQQLSSALSRNLQPNQPSLALRPLREDLDKSLEEMNILSLNTLQYRKLLELNVGNYFGVKGKDFVNNEFVSNPHDLKVVSDSIARAYSEISDFVSKINHMGTYAEYFVTSEKITEEHKNVLRIIYKSEMSINTLSDLKTRITDLYTIMRSFAAIGDQSPSTIELVSVENGSVIFDFIIGGGIILPLIYKTVKAVLEISVLNYERKMRIMEVKKLEIDVSSSLDSLQKAEENALDIVYETVIELLDSRVSEEIKGQLMTSVKKLHHFIEGGGEIDIVNQDEDVDDSTATAELSSLITEVRRLYLKEQKLIEYKTRDKKHKE